ncbi:MAG: type IV secretory system conjugative DNA transfer family protein [Candidatus Magasanikbacteria bacterium]
MLTLLIQFTAQPNNQSLTFAGFTQSITESVYFTWFVIGLIIIAILVGIAFILRAILYKKYQKAKSFNTVALQILVPSTKKSEGEGGKVEEDERLEQVKEDIAVAETFFSAIASLSTGGFFSKIINWFTGKRDDFSLEIVVENQLIKFYIDVPVEKKDFIKQQVFSQYPDAKIEEVADYNIFHKDSHILGAYLNTEKPDYFPLKTYQDLESDPLDSLLNPLSSIQTANASAAIQFVVRPSRNKWRKKGKSVVREVKKGEKIEKVANKTIVDKILDGLKVIGHELFQQAKSPENQQKQDDNYQPSSKEQELLEGIEEKISKGGLETTLRVISAADTEETARNNLDNILNAFGQYNIYQYGNNLEAYIPKKQKKVIRDYIYRSFKEKQAFVANTEEMASLWHLPLPSTEAPNIDWLTGRRSAPPSNIPKTGLKVGFVDYRGEEEDVYIKKSDRRRHLYMIGKTGSGKTVHIENMVKQDIRNGNGCGVVDPHGDLAEKALSFVPKERADDVIYFNPADMERPMGINMLEADNEEQKDLAVQGMVSIFYELFPPDMIGPMFEHHMRNCMLTLMADLDNPGTVIDIPRMFSDEDYVDEFMDDLDDPVVRNYWEEEMEQTSDYHKSEMLGYVISKVGRFAENKMMRNILGQQESSFDFREAMDEGKILIINLAKGKTGEVNAKLLGLIFVAKLQMVALARADMPEEERNDFYLYIDEFQNFVTESISTILSEARKYRLSLIMAHQYMGQLEDEQGDTSVRDAVLGNVGSIMSGRIGPDDAEILAKEFAPTFGSQDLIKPPKYHWYTKLIVDTNPTKPFLMGAPPPEEGNEEMAESIKELSRLKYGRDREIVEQEILERTQLGKNDQGEKDLSEPSL